MGKISISPEIKTLKFADIKPDPGNPRQMSDSAALGLNVSLSRFGYVDLMIINKRNMTIVSGHQRFDILKAAGVREAPCVLVDVDQKTQRALAVSMNNPKIMGEWTAEIIPILERLRKESPDDYLNLRMYQLRDDLAKLEVENEGASATLPDDVPATPAKATTKPGNIWKLGQHRLMCADSTKMENVAKLFRGSGKAKLFATDPPYFVNYTGTGRPQKGGKDWGVTFDTATPDEMRKFFCGTFKAGFEFVTENTPCYLWHAPKNISIISEALGTVGVTPHQIIIWVKPAFVLSYSVFPWRHEPCLLAWKKGCRPKVNGKAKWINAVNSSVWDIGLVRSGDPTDPKYYTDIWELDYDGKKRNVGQKHPTTKPTEVFAIPMRVHTHPGDICYEPFSGSGSQIIAAERLNRRCFAMEIEPVFCDVAVQRWEEFTGKKAKLEKGSA